MTRKHYISLTAEKYVAFILISTVSSVSISQTNDNNVDDEKPICEHFDPNCLNKNGTNCHYNKTCTGKENVCYTTWTDINPDQRQSLTDHAESIRHPSGYNVKKMGCMESDNAVTECTESCQQRTKLTQKHGHLYCCCQGKVVHI